MKTGTDMAPLFRYRPYRRPSRLWRWLGEWWLAVAVALAGAAFVAALFLPEILQ